MQLKEFYVMSEIEENKKIAREWLGFISEHKIEEICRLTAPTWKMHGGPPNLATGHEGIRQLFQTIGPVEQTWALEDVIAEGDKVVIRAVNTCVQESFFGVPGGNRKQIFSAIFIHQIANGK